MHIHTPTFMYTHTSTVEILNSNQAVIIAPTEHVAKSIRKVLV